MDTWLIFGSDVMIYLVNDHIAGWNIPMFFFKKMHLQSGSVFQPAMLDYRSVPSWEFTDPLPKALLKMIFLFPKVGYAIYPIIVIQ